MLIDRARIERIAFWITAVVAALVIWIPPYPPPVDLPQHAGQVRFLHDWMVGDFRWGEHMELNLFTPYLIGYALGALLTMVMSAVTATKLVWSMAAIATVYTSVRLRRLFGGEPTWDWLIVPGLFGMTFTWGFFSFFVSVPIGLYVLERWVVYLRAPTARNAVIVAALFQVLFFGHVLMTAWVMMVGGVMLLATQAREVSLVKLVVRGLPLLAPLPITVTWWEMLKGWGPGGRTLWRVDASRITEFLPQWLGIGMGPVVVGVGVLLLATPFVAGARFAREPARLAMLAVTLVIVMVVPYHLFGNAYTYNRFFTLLGPALVIALGTRVETRWARLRLFVPALAIVWTLLFVARMMVFRDESEDFARIVDRMEPDRHVVGMVFQKDSYRADFDLAYLHFPVWYQTATGGFTEFSFSGLAPCVVRFQRGYTSTIKRGFEFKPTDFDMTLFDYILVRGGNKDRPLASPAIREVAHEGTWWLYAPVR